MFMRVILACMMICLSVPQPEFAGEKADIELFSPEGVVKNVRQVTVRFSGQMVALGDPRLEDPFTVSCPEAGKGRWVDGRNWSYDFDRSLPAGVVCEFTLKPSLKDLAGKELTGRKNYRFSTGGPAVKQVRPWEGAENIDENQLFVLLLDGVATEET
ncbi:MAG: hypothetical protein PHN75_11670, partial [Syntrophales bacterium]|nr:hypothetical protein [Syntrophales bacterium]